MDQIQYLEINSSRRNRNLNKLPSYFEVPLSQSGQKQAIQALDPVSLGSNQLQWCGSQFNTIQGTATPSILLVEIDTILGIGNSTSTTTLLVNTKNILNTSGPGSLQIIDNYYVGAVAYIISTTSLESRRRITQYNYIGEDRAEITIESNFSTGILSLGTQLVITDPTDLSNDPYFFIPTSFPSSNSWKSFILYNQTVNQSRIVNSFDKTTHMLGIYTKGSLTSTPTQGPITAWSLSDTYSLRIENPICYIGSLDGDIINNAPSHRSFNLSIADANNISNPNILVGSFLEITMIRPTTAIALQIGGNTQVTLDPTSDNNNDYYIGSYIRMISGPIAGQITQIISYNGTTKVASLKPGFIGSTNGGDVYNLILPQQSKRIIKYTDYRSTAIGGSTTTVNFPINGNNKENPFYINNYYNDLYINVQGGGIRKISSYTVNKDPYTGTVISAIATIDTNGNPFSIPVIAGTNFTITSGLIEGGNGEFIYSIANQPAYILQFSYDNLFPFINAQSQMGNSQWYEMELLNLILPNQILDCGFGGLITFYQYVYVQIENVNGAGISGSNNIISNNSNAVGMTFRATIDDVPNPVNSTFIKIDGDGMTQIVRFDPQDNLKFAVYLGTGTNPNQKELFKVLPSEFYSPIPPNPLIQISAMFSLKKVILKQDVLSRNI